MRKLKNRYIRCPKSLGDLQERWGNLGTFWDGPRDHLEAFQHACGDVVTLACSIKAWYGALGAQMAYQTQRKETLAHLLRLI